MAQAGLGHWEPAREYTDSADADFWLALSHWEAGPDEDTRARVKSTYKAVLDAWRRAAVEYELEGGINHDRLRPGPLRPS